MASSEEQSALDREALLRSQAVSFCQSFTGGTKPPDLLDTYFVPNSPKITEHGPAWASSRLPFLGKTFSGRSKSHNSLEAAEAQPSTSTCDDYFSLLSQTLNMHPVENAVPKEKEFIVDINAGRRTEEEEAAGKKNTGHGGTVCVVVRGDFSSVRTGKRWKEESCHRLSGFDELGRIGHWEIWADPLSAWVAVGDENAAAALEEQAR